MSNQGPDYEPTPQEVERGTKEIQSRWTESQKRSRRVVKPEPVETRFVTTHLNQRPSTVGARV